MNGEDPFASFFSRGSDVKVNITLSFLEAAKGVRKEVRYPVMSSCKPCSGTGVKDHSRQRCPTCQGTGQEFKQTGFFTVGRPCSRCKGRGFTGDRCTSCDGRGTTKQTRTEKIDVPAGTCLVCSFAWVVVGSLQLLSCFLQFKG